MASFLAANHEIRAMVPSDDMFELGRALKAHGLKGEVGIKLDVDDPSRYANLDMVWVERQGALVPYSITSISIRPKSTVVRFEGIDDVDATDISQEMLDVAARKGIYQSLFTGDLTKRLPVEDGSYAGIVSSGTFTTGHVGPDAFDELLRIVQPGGLLAISINGVHFENMGFKAKLDALSDQITDLRLPEVRYYGDNASGDHKDDTGFVALFRRIRD